MNGTKQDQKDQRRLLSTRVVLWNLHKIKNQRSDKPNYSLKLITSMKLSVKEINLLSPKSIEKATTNWNKSTKNKPNLPNLKWAKGLTYKLIRTTTKFK
jgi:hypothetical protein